MFSAIYRYRGFIIDSVKRDFQSRYQTQLLRRGMADFTADRHNFRLYINFSELMRARWLAWMVLLHTASTCVLGC